MRSSLKMLRCSAWCCVGQVGHDKMPRQRCGTAKQAGQQQLPNLGTWFAAA